MLKVKMEANSTNSQKAKNSNKNSLDNCIVLGTRKRNKKVVFDPSDNNLPKRKRAPAKTNSTKVNITKQRKNIKVNQVNNDRTHESSGGNNNGTTGGVCSVCRLQKKDRFVSCRDCCNKAHFGCLDTNVGILRLRPDNTWQCPHCKTCAVCEETADSGALTVCKICSDAYHSHCHSPKIVDKSTGSPKWVCYNCEAPSSDFDNMSDAKIIKIEDMETMGITQKSIENNKKSKSKQIKQKSVSMNNKSIKVEPSIKSNSNNKVSKAACDESKTKDVMYSDDFGYEIDPLIPDARNWSSDDVYNYFTKFFPNEAIIFKNEEIDGLALLLMTRETVMEDLKLKIGTALRLYRHICILQERRDNPKRYFF